jgi:hypothetical protein
VHKLVVLFLAAAFTAPPEALRDLSTAEGDSRKAGWPRGYFDTWYARRLKQVGIDASVVDRLGLRLERLAPGLRDLSLMGSQADRLVPKAELVL